jgi:transglutaminase-like putative cysteine protease
MRKQFPRTALASAALIALAAVAAEPASAPVLSETWESVRLDGARIGSLHTTVREVGPGKLRSTAELDLTMRCYGTLVHVRREYGTDEASDGRVSGVFMKQTQDRGKQLTVTGTVEGDRLHVIVDGGRIERRLRWGEDVLGLAAQERLLTERRPKAGEQFSFRRYEATYNSVVNVQVRVKGTESVGPDGKKLLRVELKPDRIEADRTSIQPPGSVVWLDEAFFPVRREMELDGVGTVLLERATRESASGAPERSADIGLRTTIALDRRITNPHATQSVVYRITMKGEPPSALARDEHQEVRNIRGDSFELHVHPVHPVPGAGPGPAAPEYLSANYYVDSDDACIKDLARRIPGNETDVFARAVRIEQWVFGAMRPKDGSPLVPASQVARELQGDCKSYALLTTALCRAAGIPSRTAIGLVYAERGSAGPKLVFHMWTEVCVGGRWLGLDGTLGQGGIGACHLKISDHSWYATRSLTPLLPASRVLGKVSVSVVSVDGRK